MGADFVCGVVFEAVLALLFRFFLHFVFFIRLASAF